jgi:hypothetical protein
MRRDSKLSSRIVAGIIWLIIAAGILLRLKLYGDPRLSIATNDTESYVTSSQSPILSWEIFTGRRVFTNNLIYRLFVPENGYQILVNGSGDTTSRAYQPGFENLALFHFLMSVIGWSFLILISTKYIHNYALKLVCAITLLLFAFSPQIAEWDSILMSESLTISLFILQFSLLIKIIFNAYFDNGKLPFPLLLSWLIVYFLWTFIRDTNLYAIPVSILMSLVLWRVGKFSNTKPVVALLTILLGMFILGWSVSRSSVRSRIEIRAVYESDLLSIPGRVAILQSLGMPDPESPAFTQWFEENGVVTFVKFMLLHPGYVAARFGRDIFLVFGESLQPYFRIPELGDVRERLVRLGGVLHPETAMPIHIGLILLMVLIQFGADRSRPASRPWILIGLWLFSVAGLTMFVSVMAGTYALYRHALFSTMAFRLFMWLFLFVVLDQGLDKNRMGLEYNHAPKVENAG